MKIISLLLSAVCLIQSFSISKAEIPTLYTNKQFYFDIEHSGVDKITFKLMKGPDFAELLPNGTFIFYPKRTGAFQLKISCASSTRQLNLSYIVRVKQLKTENGLWVLEEQDYYARTNERPLQLKSDNFVFQRKIFTNQNIWLKLYTNNQIGASDFFYEFSPNVGTLKGRKNDGIVSGYVEQPGTYFVKCIVIDQRLRIGQLYLSLQFQESPLNLQVNMPVYGPIYTQGMVLPRENISNPNKEEIQSIEKKLNNLISQEKKLLSFRLEMVANYRKTTLQRQQLILNEEIASEQIVSLAKANNMELEELSKAQNELNLQAAQIVELRRVLTRMEQDFSIQLEQTANAQNILAFYQKQAKDVEVQFNFVRRQIETLQDQLYTLQGQIKQFQHDKNRANISYVTFQNQQNRSRQLLEVRRNIEFQYLVRKAKTDNKVLQTRDEVFLAQSTYDASYSSYKTASVNYMEKLMQAQNLDYLISLTLQKYEQLSSVMKVLKLDYQLALGSYNTLKTAKQQLNSLSQYAINQIANKESQLFLDSNSVSELDKADIQAKEIVSEYPFTGCNTLGGFAYAGSGKISFIGKNSLRLVSGEVVNFGRCTEAPKTEKLVQDLWIQFRGYFWEGSVQATRISVFMGRS